MAKITGKYQISDWQEAAYFEVAAPAKARRADIKLVFEGAMEGRGDLTYLMTYVDDGLAYYSGMIYFNGSLDGRRGGFVILDSGVFNADGATSKWVIAKGSGTGALAGITGTGGYASASAREVAFELDFTIGDQNR